LCWLLVPCSFCLGCGTFLDEVTSRDLLTQMKAPREPLAVLKSNADADRRADALRALKEPKQHGGADQQQDEVMEILTKAATDDPHARCRWAAIQTLGRFKDLRAVKVVETAYDKAAGVSSAPSPVYQAGYFPKTGAFQPETASTLRCQALLSLGQTGDPKAVDLLIRVLRQPPVEGTDQERKLTLDEKIHAARALSHFQGDPRVTDALLGVLRDEKDIALRNRAHDSLQTITGKKVASTDFKAWDEALHEKPKEEKPKADEKSPKESKPTGEGKAQPEKKKFLGLF
jgi:hypothetical protein